MRKDYAGERKTLLSDSLTGSACAVMAEIPAEPVRIGKTKGIYKMKRLLFFDIDGTLAIPGQTPSRETVEAIRAARANGHKTFLCTGRTEESVPGPVREIGFDGAIYSAGGRVVAGGKVIEDHAMTQNMTRTIISVMRQAGVSFTLECAGGNYSGGPDLMRPASSDMSGGNSELRRMLLISNKRPVTQYKNEPVYKISFFAASQEQTDYIAGAFDQTVKVVFFENLIQDFPLLAGEASDRNVHKGLALLRVCEYFGAALECSVAFGDSMNDAEMLQTAGIGVAMGNSSDQVKALADQVCETCADNGVAKTLARLGLTGKG